MPHKANHQPMGPDMTQQSSYAPASETDGYSEPSTTAQVKEKAKEVGAMAQERVDEGMDKAAESVQSAAETVREKARERGGVTEEYGTRAADVMEDTATYLRETDSAQMMDDIERYVRQHPVQAVAGAIVGGFILGRLLG